MKKVAVAAMVITWLVSCTTPSPEIPEAPTAVSAAYRQEFLQATQQRLDAPDGTSTIEWDQPGSATLSGCHVIWLNREGIHYRDLIIRLAEESPGSGASFTIRFSDDSKAVFIWGRHSGLGCSRTEQSPFGFVYLPEEKTLFNLGPQPSDVRS